MLVAASIGSAVTRHFGHHGEGVLIAAVGCSLPFILVRLVYSALAAFAHNSSFNIVTGSVTVMLAMAVLEEIAVVAIYTITGLKLEVIPKNQQSENGVKNSTYRAGRGDFGLDKLGVFSLLAAAVGELTSTRKREPKFPEKTLDTEV